MASTTCVRQRTKSGRWLYAQPGPYPAPGEAAVWLTPQAYRAQLRAQLDAALDTSSADYDEDWARRLRHMLEDFERAHKEDCEHPR